MKATITSLELKGPLKFFALSASARQIVKQLRGTNYVAFKKRGVWTKHYTMTLWKSEEDLKTFAKSGAHLEAMKRSKEIAKEIRTITIDANELPSWAEAKMLLEKGKVIRY
jgi:heme-degrading monooxygenase HmoA